MSEEFSFQNVEGRPEDVAVDAIAEVVSPLADSSMAGQAHAQVSRYLERHIQESEAASFSLDAHSGAGNVVGVGVGLATPESAEWIAEPGIPALRVYLIEPMSEPQVRRILREEISVEGAEDPELPVRPVVTGEIEAFSHRFRHRPAHGGLSIGHQLDLAGTLGCLVRGRSGPRRERTLILSNNHVVADSNKGHFGDAIVQPGVADGGVVPNDQIAALERFVPIQFPPSGPNEVDCATGWADPDLVDSRIAYLDHGGLRLFRLSPTIQQARVGDRVEKSGRTTQLTSGEVKNVRATIRVRYGSQVALFENQIEVTGKKHPFGAPGDSGSVIWSLDEERHPVGLLFAGGLTSIFANPIDRVLDALDVEIIA